MSAILFHTSNEDYEDVKLSGAERHYMSMILSDLFCSLIDTSDNILKVFPKDHYIHDEFKRFRGIYSEGQRRHALNLCVSHGSESFIFDKKEVDVFTTVLNTALRIGSDQLKLLARLHAQSELHCWVAGKNRKWLADIMQKGLDSGMYREEVGWQKVIKFLRKDSKHPVVTSFTVCESFPNASAAGVKYSEDDEGSSYDAWEEKPFKERWDEAFKGINKRDRGLELKPQDWNDFYFGDGFDVFDLNKWVQKQVNTEDIVARA